MLLYGMKVSFFFTMCSSFPSSLGSLRRCCMLQVMQQEGWHYELENKDDPLTYKGVVFNEMKGVYSSPDSLHGRTCQQVTSCT